jgi:hypothetical protein
MRRALLSMLMIGLLAASLTGCGGASSAITGPGLMETTNGEP